MPPWLRSRWRGCFGIGRQEGDWAAVVVVSVLLFMWGLIAGVRNGETTPHVFADGSIGASLGVLIAALKLGLK